jgi:myosin heavy subunit
VTPTYRRGAISENRSPASGPGNRGGSSSGPDKRPSPSSSCGGDSRSRLLESKLKEAEKENSEVNQELQATIARCKAAKDQLQAAQEKMKVLEAELKEARGELDGMAEELSGVEDSLQTVQRERDQYRLWWRNEVEFSRMLMGNVSPFHGEIAIAQHSLRRIGNGH